MDKQQALTDSELFELFAKLKEQLIGLAQDPEAALLLVDMFADVALDREQAYRVAKASLFAKLKEQLIGLAQDPEAALLLVDMFADAALESERIYKIVRTSVAIADEKVASMTTEERIAYWAERKKENDLSYN